MAEHTIGAEDARPRFVGNRSPACRRRTSVTPQWNRPSWLASSVALLTVGLVACGSAATQQEAGTTPASKTPQVIHVGGNWAPAPAAATMAADAESNAKLRPWAPVTYVYNGTPPDLTGPAGSWYFPPDGGPSNDAIAAVAAALGVSGDVVAVPAEQGGGWLVGPTDYSAPTVSVGTDAMHGWSYNSPTAYGATSVGGCAVVAPEPPLPIETAVPTPSAPVDTMPVDTLPVDTTAVDETACANVEPQPPAGVPTADEARAKATALFSAMGIDLSTYDIETYADAWSANVTAYLRLDGVRSNVSISAGYGAEGALTWASGFLGTPQRGGDYDRIGVEAAIQRLNDHNVPWMTGGPMALDSASAATGEIHPGAATSSGTAEAGVSAPVPADPSIAVAPIPCPDAAADVATECGAVGDPVTITLTNARPSLEQLWADDGTVWLLPGYAFDSSEGGLPSVIAVQDQFIEVTAPAPTPLPVEGSIVPVDTTPPNTGDPTEPAPVPPPTNIPTVTAAPVDTDVPTS